MIFGIMKMKIIDNFLNSEDFIRLIFELDDPNMPWVQSTILSSAAISAHFRKHKKIILEDKYNIQFCHILGENEEFLQPLFKKLGVVNLHRCKVNLTVANENHIGHGFHIDISGGIQDTKQAFNCTTAILYINDNNGYTEFDNGEKVKSVQNRVVIFKNGLLHQGVSCTDVAKRLVLNINYETEEQVQENMLDKLKKYNK